MINLKISDRTYIENKRQKLKLHIAINSLKFHYHQAVLYSNWFYKCDERGVHRKYEVWNIKFTNGNIRKELYKTIDLLKISSENSMLIMIYWKV